MVYDYIIIGAGIAGLYAAYNLKNKYPDKTFLVLEANSKKYIGGRVRQEMFNNHLVNTGAGIGRKHKDKYLIELLNELKIKYTEFSKEPKY
jgi:protoporphyrinogen oxidase